MTTYRILWDPDQPEKGVDILALSPGRREVVQHYTYRHGAEEEEFLVLHSPGHTWYTGRVGSQSAYAPSRFEVYRVIKQITVETWEVEQLLEFPARFKKKAE